MGIAHEHYNSYMGLWAYGLMGLWAYGLMGLWASPIVMSAEKCADRGGEDRVGVVCPLSLVSRMISALFNSYFLSVYIFNRNIFIKNTCIKK